jgi:hypothetical protein
VTAALGRAARVFGRFWWEFLVGDTPELFFATLVVVGVALLLRHERPVAVVLLPLLAVVMLVASAFRGRRRASGAEGEPPADDASS